MKPFLTPLALLSVAASVSAQSGTLGHPFPQPSPNAALHYQRGMLYVAALSDQQNATLDKAVWITVSKGFSPATTRLLYDGRFAIQAASYGSRLADCDFGIDFGRRGAATPLPHLHHSLRLARLMALRGHYAQSQGRWEEAAILYFDGLRFGRHLTHQNTFLEALTGLKVIRENLHLLANWSAQCPHATQVGSAFVQLEFLAPTFVDAASLVVREASILSLELDAIDRNYPDGPWAEMVLASYGLKAESEDRGEIETKATEEAIRRGVPSEVFETPRGVANHLERLDSLTTRFAEASAACMTLPVKPRLERGRRLYEKYQKLLQGFGDNILFDPAEIGALVASFEADVCAARVILAVASSKTEVGFPEDLSHVAQAFGGKVPVSPYDGSPLHYHVDGQGITVEINEAGAADITLPRVSFSTTFPQPPEAEGSE